MAAELDSGSVIINDSTDYRLDSMPFGGVKSSGLGKEDIRFSLAEMTEPKVISWYLPGLKGSCQRSFRMPAVIALELLRLAVPPLVS